MADAVARHVVTFGRVLREAGLEVGPGRLADALTGLDLVDLVAPRRRLLDAAPDARLALGGPGGVRRRVSRLVPPRSDGAGVPPGHGGDVAAGCCGAAPSGSARTRTAARRARTRRRSATARTSCCAGATSRT